MSEKRRIVLNTAANGVAQFAAMLSALVFMPFLVKGFGAENYGLYLLATSVSGYAGLLDLGIGASVTKFTAESSATSDSEKASTVVSSAVAFYTVVGVVVAAIMLLLALNSGQVFRVSADGARLLRNLFLAAVAWSLWSWPANTAVAVLAGYQRYTRSATASLIAVVGNIGVTIAVLATHQGPLALMLGNYAVWFCTGVLQILWARQAMRPATVAAKYVHLDGLRSMFGFAWAIFVLQVCTVIVYQQTDRLVLGVFLGAAAVALYEAAGKFQGLVSQITAFAVSAVMPVASQFDAQGRKDSLRSLFLRGSKYALALVNPIVIVLMVVAHPLLEVWLGARFASYALAAQILISHQLLTSGAAVGGSMLGGLGLVKRRVPYAVGIATLNLTLSLLLVRPLGILGVVLGTAIPYFIDYPFHIRILLKATDVTFAEWLRRTVLPTYPLLIVPLALSLWLRTTVLHTSIVGIAAIGAASVGAYWLAFLGLGLEPHERQDVRGGIRAAWARATGRA